MDNFHSFSDYVRRNYYNEIFEAIQNFIDESKPEDLELYFRETGKSNKPELDDIRITKVNAYAIKYGVSFDAITDADLIVRNRDFRHNDKEDIKGQKFTVSCKVYFDGQLKNFEVIATSIYKEGKEHHEIPLSDDLVPVIRKEKLEMYADWVVNTYYDPKAVTTPMYVDPLILASHLKLKISERKITENCNVFGQIFFKDTDADIYDENLKKSTKVAVKKGTVFVDPDVVFQRTLGSKNTTIVHECVHWIFHHRAVLFQILFNEELSQLRCEVSGGIEGQKSDSTKWMEWQANALAPRIQMPLPAFKIKAAELFKKYGREYNNYEQGAFVSAVIEDLASFYHVSKLAAKIRLIDAGYSIASSAFVYMDGHYVPPHGFSEGSLQPNQTFSIPIIEAVIKSVTDPRLRENNKYVFVENHFVIRAAKYVTQTEDGTLALTYYGRFHLDECALAFDLKVQNSEIDGKYYYTECYLNKEEHTPIKFDYVLADEQCDNLKIGEKEALHDKELRDEAEVEENLSRNPKKAWKTLIDWRGTSQKRLIEVTKLSENTVLNIVNNKTTPQLNSVVLMCLALHLPYNISMHMLDITRCGGFDLSNDAHIQYRFLLQFYSTHSLEDCIQYLNDHHVPTL